MQELHTQENEQLQTEIRAKEDELEELRRQLRVSGMTPSACHHYYITPGKGFQTANEEQDYSIEG